LFPCLFPGGPAARAVEVLPDQRIVGARELRHRPDADDVVPAQHGDPIAADRDGGVGRHQLVVHGVRRIQPAEALVFGTTLAAAGLAWLATIVMWIVLYRMRRGRHLRAVGENPAAADAQGINVFRMRYWYVFVGGLLAGLGGATISLAISPGWFSELTTGGQGWIAVGLVIFAQWDPIRAAVGAYAFGALRRLILDIQGPMLLFGLANPFYYNSYLGFFLQMLPYAFTIVVLVIGSREAMRKRLGAPAALGNPYIRGERGK